MLSCLPFPLFFSITCHFPSFLLYFVLLPGLEARVRCRVGAAKSLGPRAKASWAGSQISEATGDHKSRWPPPPQSQRAAKGRSHDHIQGLRWSQQDPGEWWSRTA